ncbi:MAG: XamI family restriction endonuclease [Pseudanabaenales cyanobacterium]|nr:XamI family restriction endonuclease [Pseudanabaenales cyanobacterium]
MPVNLDKPHLWKSDSLHSIDFYNDWFLRFAPSTFREQRKLKAEEVANALSITDYLRGLTIQLLKDNPGILPMLRMTTAPPIARDRLIGLAYTTKSLVSSLEGSAKHPPRIPPRIPSKILDAHLERIIDVLREVADRDLFSWLDDPDTDPTEEDLLRSASVVADRLCGAAADPIIRNAQEQRQLHAIGIFLKSYNYTEIASNDFNNLLAMPPGTYTFRCNISAGSDESSVNIPVDCVVSNHTRQPDAVPLLIEAKSAGDTTNTNKRRKEEAQKFSQLKQKFGDKVPFILFLCGYFEPGYLGYEASEGIDWVWEHRITDLLYYLEDNSSLPSRNLAQENPGLYSSDFMQLEAERFRRQQEVDSSKTSLIRNQLGQFSTPFSLAQQISRYTISLLSGEGESRHMLEPAVGSGVFISSIISLSPQNLTYTSIEIDALYSRICEELFSEFGCNVLNQDFFSFIESEESQENFDLVITNPPYVRHHHFESETKKQYQEKVLRVLGISVSGLAGLYIYYILLCDQLLRDGAVASWLIPSEFLYVNYGRALREYLYNHVSLIRIHRFEAQNVQFNDALVSSCIITYKKKKSATDLLFSLTKGAYENPSIHYEVRRSSISYTEKWDLFDLDQADTEDGIALENLFHITRGLATGNNDFFILDPQQINEKKIPSQFLVPVLPSPRHIKSSIIESDSAGVPLLTQQKFLLLVTLSPEEIRCDYPDLFQYLEEGKKMGVHNRYLCRTRKRWYFQEKREPPLFVATYMGRRSSNGNAPIRFLLNRSRAIATNVFICLYPKPELLYLLQQSRAREIEILETLNQIPIACIQRAGRSYGGGLQKIEPKELRSLCVKDLPEWLSFKEMVQIEMFGTEQALPQLIG